MVLSGRGTSLCLSFFIIVKPEGERGGSNGKSLPRPGIIGEIYSSIFRRVT
jgi:hypothetical protein